MNHYANINDKHPEFVYAVEAEVLETRMVMVVRNSDGSQAQVPGNARVGSVIEYWISGVDADGHFVDYDGYNLKALNQEPASAEAFSQTHDSGDEMFLEVVV